MLMTTRNFLLVLILYGAIQVGCQSNKSSKGNKIPASKKADSAVVQNTEEDQNLSADNAQGNIEDDQTIYPFDFENKSILIVPNAEFHSDGRDQIEAKKEWMGLFKTKSGVYLNSPEIKLTSSAMKPIIKFIAPAYKNQKMKLPK